MDEKQSYKLTEKDFVNNQWTDVVAVAHKQIGNRICYPQLELWKDYRKGVNYGVSVGVVKAKESFIGSTFERDGKTFVTISWTPDKDTASIVADKCRLAGDIFKDAHVIEVDEALALVNGWFISDRAGFAYQSLGDIVIVEESEPLKLAKEVLARGQNLHNNA